MHILYKGIISQHDIFVLLKVICSEKFINPEKVFRRLLFPDTNHNFILRMRVVGILNARCQDNVSYL